MVKSTATRIVRFMEARGIGRAQIRADHLMGLYGCLKRHRRNYPDPSITSILPAHGPELRDDDCIGVIVETRPLPSLAFTIRNFLEVTGYPAQIFHGNDNAAMLAGEPFRTWAAQGKLILTPMQVSAVNASHYNGLLTAPAFWDLVAGRRKVLVFQTDSICCPQSDFKLNAFFGLDYIGAYWRRRRAIGIICDGGNGGLSLRDWTVSHDCTTRFPAANWPSGEDSFFGFHADIVTGRVGNEVQCQKFATESLFTFKSFGAHKISKLRPDHHAAFLRYCPEVTFIQSSERPKAA